MQKTIISLLLFILTGCAASAGNTVQILRDDYKKTTTISMVQRYTSSEKLSSYEHYEAEVIYYREFSEKEKKPVEINFIFKNLSGGSNKLDNIIYIKINSSFYQLTITDPANQVEILRKSAFYKKEVNVIFPLTNEIENQILNASSLAIRFYFRKNPATFEVKKNSDTSIDNLGNLKKFLKFDFADNKNYIGEMLNGRPDGFGTYYYGNGSKYEGDWVNGKREGKGTMTENDGAKYEGQWKDDMRNGEGTQIYSNRMKYEGPWLNDKRHGEGIITSQDGKKHYLGRWENDKYIKE